MTDTSTTELTQRQKTASITSTQCDNDSSSSGPVFVLDGYRHDQNTFKGRLQHQLETTHPKLMFKSDTEINAALKLLKDFKYNPEKVLNTTSHAELWRAQTIKRASTNADTSEIIPQPFRLCGFVTWNMPVLVGLVWPNPSTATILFWQWANQTHNGAINYYNRNATNPTDPKLLATSYFAACSGAMTVPFLFKKFINSKPWDADKKARMARFSAFPAVVVANTINMFCMRSKELIDGIEVIDSKTGKKLGHSRKAAQEAVSETAISRAIISAGVLFVPPLIDNVLQQRIDLKYANHPRLRLIKTSVLVVVCAACFYAVLPVSVAAFTQYKKMPVSKLEPELKNKAEGDYVIYNRGQ